MTDAELRPVADGLIPFEGKVGNIYLDNAKPPRGPYPTIGIGCKISSVAEAEALPLIHLSTGLPATPDEIAAELARVRAMPGGLPWRRYRGDLYLPEKDVYALAYGRLREALGDLPRLFPAFDTFPTPVKQCLLDLRWNCGFGGLSAFHDLLVACNSQPPDWSAGEEQCTTANPDNDKGRARRNAWRQACFAQAAQGSS